MLLMEQDIYTQGDLVYSKMIIPQVHLFDMVN